MHRNVPCKPVNRTMDVEACDLLTPSTHFESGVVNRIAKQLATSAVLTFRAITNRRSWFTGCQSLLHHRSKRATSGHLALTVGSVQMNTTPKECVHNALSSSKKLENSESNCFHRRLNARTRTALCR